MHMKALRIPEMKSYTNIQFYECNALKENFVHCAYVNELNVVTMICFSERSSYVHLYVKSL